VGFVSYTINYSIWSVDYYMNVDDVFVLGQYRGGNIGESLILEIKSICKKDGISKVRWEVQSDNLGAIKFYEKLGATLNVKGIFSWNLEKV